MDHRFGDFCFQFRKMYCYNDVNKGKFLKLKEYCKTMFNLQLQTNVTTHIGIVRTWQKEIKVRYLETMFIQIIMHFKEQMLKIPYIF